MPLWLDQSDARVRNPSFSSLAAGLVWSDQYLSHLDSKGEARPHPRTLRLWNDSCEARSSDAGRGRECRWVPSRVIKCIDLRRPSCVLQARRSNSCTEFLRNTPLSQTV